MTICERFQIVVVPFPFVDAPVSKSRPALVLSNQSFNREHRQAILAMITSAARSHWPSDVTISEMATTGLRARSVVRFKLFTLPDVLISRVIGRLAAADADRVAGVLARTLA